LVLLKPYHHFRKICGTEFREVQGKTSIYQVYKRCFASAVSTYDEIGLTIEPKTNWLWLSTKAFDIYAFYSVHVAPFHISLAILYLWTTNFE
tara:strand:+ start:2274 stop:2549 length:276 start_codon:yes stop_codon:yes gene_type:complete